MPYDIPLSVARHVYKESGGDQGTLLKMIDHGDTWDEFLVYRYIHEDEIDHSLVEELEDNPELVGMFNADFLSGVTGWPESIIKAGQEKELWEDIGEAVIDEGFISELADRYASADGYGHHFAHYDGETVELAGGWLAFKVM